MCLEFLTQSAAFNLHFIALLFHVFYLRSVDLVRVLPQLAKYRVHSLRLSVA